MPNPIAKCGMDCSICPWGPYPRQTMTQAEFGQYKQEAKRILGYTPMKTACNTCQVPDDQIPKGDKLPPRNCLVRQCVDRSGLQHCGYCTRFPCACEHAHATLWTRAVFEKRHGRILTNQEYTRYVKPFEALPRLQKLHKSINPNALKHPVTLPPLKMKVEPFPNAIPSPKKSTFKKLHQLLRSIKEDTHGIKDTDTYPNQTQLKNRIHGIMRFLFLFGSQGTPSKDNRHLTVDATSYIKNKASDTWLAIWVNVNNHIIKRLKKFGIHLNRQPLEGVTEKDLDTPTGYMRDKGWTMTMTLDQKAGGTPTLKALQTFTTTLEEKYQTRAFRYFADIDMTVLT